MLSSGSVNISRIFLNPGNFVSFSGDVSVDQLMFAPDSSAIFSAGSDIAINSIQVKRPAGQIDALLEAFFARVGFDGILNIDISHMSFPEDGAFAIRVDGNCVVTIVGEDSEPFLGTDTDLFV